jgi:peptide methionine sulfoxide reductase msrA/msrB
MVSGWGRYAGAGLAAALVLALAGCGAAAERESEGRKRMSNLDRTEEEWKRVLTPEQYRVLRRKGTERAFTGRYWDHKGTGVYACAGCGQELFASSTKFKSGSGWPSFWQPVAEGRVAEEADRSHGMVRTEVLCGRCGGHLGHVFNDGPQPTGQRYCINSAALDFKAAEEAGPAADPAAPAPAAEVATLGAGCFWCTEAIFESIDGVSKVEAGYMGGHVKNPTYKAVCTGKTGHAEVAQITFDPRKVSYEKLLEAFWQTHDPTTLNRQGNDVGPHYRSVIFTHSDAQKAAAEKSLQAHRDDFKRPIVTEIVPASTFYKAEDYHQDYFANNPNAPYCRAIIAPKLKKFLGK